MTRLLLLFSAFLASASACLLSHRRLLSEPFVQAVTALSHVANVPNTKGCMSLCVREQRCAAVRFNPSTNSCHLLTARIDMYEGAVVVSAPLEGKVEVWILPDRGFGVCPVEFKAKLRAARYRLYSEAIPLNKAKELCEKQGAKIAEFTSQEEIAFVTRQLVTTRYNTVVHVGGFQQGEREPREGWRWSRSGLPVDMSLFSTNQPDNGGAGEDYLTAVVRQNSFTLNDVPRHYRAGVICECVHVGI